MTPDQKKKKAAEIWKVLSAIDCSEHVEKRNGLSYLSWSWAWRVLMEHYPDAEYTFERFDGTDVMRYADGTCAVFCTLTIDGLTREMSLPVFDHRHRSIKEPDSAAINKNRMRCLVKCIGLFGLGLYLYSGEDLPSTPALEQPPAKPKPQPAAKAKSDRPRTAAQPTPQAKAKDRQIRDRLAGITTLDDLYAQNDLRIEIKSMSPGTLRSELIDAWRSKEESLGGSISQRPDFGVRDGASVGRVADVMATQ